MVVRNDIEAASFSRAAATLDLQTAADRPSYLLNTFPSLTPG